MPPKNPATPAICRGPPAPVAGTNLLAVKTLPPLPPPGSKKNRWTQGVAAQRVAQTGGGSGAVAEAAQALKHRGGCAGAASSDEPGGRKTTSEDAATNSKSKPASAERKPAAGCSSGSSKNAAAAAGAAGVSAVRNFRSRPKGFRVCCAGFVVLVYLGASMVLFPWLEGWSRLDSLYFATTVLTTVGYGDFSPSHFKGKLVVAVYAVVAIFIIAAALGIITEFLLERAMKRTMERAEVGQSQGGSRWSKFTVNVFMVVVVLGFGTFFFSWQEKMSLVDAFYFSVITCTTVGLGDFSPTTALGKGVCAIWMVCGVGVCASCVSQFESSVLRKSLQESLPALAAAEELRAEQTEEKERFEHLCARLRESAIVEKAIIEEIMARFDELDKDGNGVIEPEELRM